MVVNGTRDVVGLGNVGFRLKATVVVVNGVFAAGATVVGRGALFNGVEVEIDFGAVVAGKVVKLRAAFF